MSKHFPLLSKLYSKIKRIRLIY